MFDVDQHVANRLRARRCALGLTLSELAEVGGVELLQLQGYEMGCDQVSAAALWRLARALDVEPSYFFEGLAGGEAGQAAQLRPFAGPTPTSH